MLYLAGRYRERLYLLVFLLVFAFASSWLYTDIAAYLREHHPGLELYALALKTAIVYGAILYAFWVLRPGQTPGEALPVPPGKPKPGAEPQSRVEHVAAREQLNSRYEALLSRKSRPEDLER